MIKDGFRYESCFGKPNQYDTLIIKEQKLDDYIEYINKNNIKSISIKPEFYSKNEINFLKECKHLENVHIQVEGIDYSGLYKLDNLKALSLNNYSQKNTPYKLDLGQFPNLELLSAEWGEFIGNLDKCKNLISLQLWKYKPSSKDLQELSHLEQLKVLVLTQSNISSLEGCKGLNKLQCLQLYYLRNLEKLDGIEAVSNSLKNLRINNCKKIENYEYLLCLKELILLDISDNGEIQSIDFIKRLKKLKSFIFVNTNVLDGNLESCLGLDYVGFLNKRHYSHKENDFLNERITEDFHEI